MSPIHVQFPNIINYTLKFIKRHCFAAPEKRCEKSATGTAVSLIILTGNIYSPKEHEIRLDSYYLSTKDSSTDKTKYVNMCCQTKNLADAF